MCVCHTVLHWVNRIQFIVKSKDSLYNESHNCVAVEQLIWLIDSHARVQFRPFLANNRKTNQITGNICANNFKIGTRRYMNCMFQTRTRECFRQGLVNVSDKDSWGKQKSHYTRKISKIHLEKSKLLDANLLAIWSIFSAFLRARFDQKDKGMFCAPVTFWNTLSTWNKRVRLSHWW